MDPVLPPLPPEEFIPRPPIDVPAKTSKFHPYFQKTLGQFLTVLVLGILTIGSGGLLYYLRGQNISPTGPGQSSASAQTTIFDNFDGSALDTTKWASFPASTQMTISNNMLNIVSATTSSGLWYSTGKISGDYTLEVTMANFSASPSGSAVLSVNYWNTPTDEAVNLLSWNLRDANNAEVELASRFNGNLSTSHPYLTIPRSTQSARFKLSRTGNIVQGFVDYGSGYQLVGSIPDAWNGEGYINITLWGNPATLSLDSFTGNVTFVGIPETSPTPTPTSTSSVGQPNSCGGTCGSNSNCGNGLFCYQGYCRNYLCASSTNCTCTSPTPTPVVTTTSAPTVSYPPFSSPTPEVINFTGNSQTYTYVPGPTPALDLEALVEPAPEPVAQLSWWQRFVNFILKLFGAKY